VKRFSNFKQRMVGVKEVKELSSAPEERPPAMLAFNVSQEDYDVMLRRIPARRRRIGPGAAAPP
jgi:hypothetical protein